jgi:hypothetical protein
MGSFESSLKSLPPAPGAGTVSGNAPTNHDALPADGDGPGLPGTGGTDGFGGFGQSFLTGAVGRGQANRPDDVWTASYFLADNGFLPEPTRAATEDFYQGIEAAQTKLSGLTGGGLRVDGFARPSGPTEILAQRAVTAGELTQPPFIATSADAPKAPLGANIDLDNPGRSAGRQVANIHKIRARAGGARPAEANKAVAPPHPTVRNALAGDGLGGAHLSDPRDPVKKTRFPKPPADPAKSIDPVKAASEFRHIATFKPGRFERDADGTPALQGEPLDSTKADLMERALKARDANDLDAFEAMLKRQDNSLTGPEKDFLRGVAENRFEHTTDREFDAITAEGLKTMGVEPTGGGGETVSATMSGIPKDAQETAPAGQANPDDEGKRGEAPPTADPIDPVDGSEGLHHRELATRKSGRSILADLRTARDRDRPLTPDEVAALDRRIEDVYPHDAEMQDRMKALARAEAGTSKRGGEIPANAKERRAALDRLAEQVDDPARLKAQRETQTYMDKLPQEARERTYVKRGIIRERMEGHAADALAISAQMEEQRKIIESQQPMANSGDPNAQRLVNDATARLGRLNTALEAQAGKIAGAGADLAALPTHPHPDLDKRGADIQEATETRARTRRELITDAGLAAGTLGGAALARAGRKGAALVLGRGVTAGQAASNFARGFNREIARAAGKAGIDMADPAAVARWAKANPQIARRATAKALGDATTGLISDHAAGKLAETFNVGPVGEELASKGIQSAIDSLRKQGKRQPE